MKQMLKEEAKQLAVQEYLSWRSTHVNDEALIFYAYLKKEKSHLLNFKASGDKWQVIPGWILNGNL